MWTISIRVQKPLFPSNKNNMNSSLLQGNDEGLDTETFNKTRWETP